MLNEINIVWRVLVVLRERWTTLRAEPEAGYSSEFWVVTAAVVAIAVGALAWWAVQITTAVHGIQLTTNTPGS